MITSRPMPFAPASIPPTVLGFTSPTSSTALMVPVLGLYILTEGLVLIVTGKETLQAIQLRVVALRELGFPRLTETLPGVTSIP